jgi:transcriptional regulator with XRE-family HTH domain
VRTAETGNVTLQAVTDPNVTSIQKKIRELGRQLALFRRAAEYTQARLSQEIGYSRSTIANIEIGRQRGVYDFWEHCDKLLGADGALVRGYDQITELQMQRHREEFTRIKAERDSRLAAQGIGCPLVPLLRELIDMMENTLTGQQEMNRPT